jgi:hypothetical protein
MRNRIEENPMTPKTFLRPLAALIVLAAVAAVPVAAQVPLEVTITNLTRGQVFSNPLVITHDPHFSLFALGQPASPELAIQAEDGDPAPLIGVISADPSVFDFNVADDVIPPGGSITVTVDAANAFRRLTVSGMLVTTNDAFFATRGLEILSSGNSTLALAYDAGSEGNAELCDHIPGPPCMNGGVPNPTGAEGYVHVHAGIHGIADLASDEFDWRNPVALIEVRRAP